MSAKTSRESWALDAIAMGSLETNGATPRGTLRGFALKCKKRRVAETLPEWRLRVRFGGAARRGSSCLAAAAAVP